MRRRLSLTRTLNGDTYAKERRLFADIAPAVARALPGTEVLAVELLSPSRFCVYVDDPRGVDFALCEQVTHVLGEYRDDWTIDVSSPGPERPVRTIEQFRRALGRTVQIRTATEVAGTKRFRGTVAATDDTAVVVETDGGALRIPVEDIVRGNLIDEGR